MPNDNVLTDEQILDVFRDAGLDLNATTNMLYAVRGQHAQLLKAARVLLSHPGQPEPRAEVTDAVRDVLAERHRQVTAEGWTPERDDKYTKRELAYAASNYAVSELKHGDPPITWPWDKLWWKPTTPRRNLVKAGALILAEIERLDRDAARTGASS
ncbi:hypothetical protein [Burkholderia sp. EMB26]|uniref:hypothetical protein n=1 Tax=Burkholderia sp. EMB26 TaxID=2854261 RepID=UPI00215A11BF|nr:hypothetical protein [Burkholderia sp. EMB26]UVE55270.1 hypothetical protein KU887_06245 [Burkholderia sp. EMB26]UVE57658.1 hypothetical protein KU887_19955 [Burkholderia sp. EMB26]